MFESLSDKLESAFKNLKGQGTITELNIASTIKEIRRALVDADVNYKIAKEFTDRVKDKAVGEKVINAISPGQLMTKIVKDEFVILAGTGNEPPTYPRFPVTQGLCSAVLESGKPIIVGNGCDQ